MVKYLELHQVEALKRTKQPRQRLDSLGYTLRGGSPTDLMLLIEGRWRRIYVIQFSNAGSAFVKLNREQYFLGRIDHDIRDLAMGAMVNENPVYPEAKPCEA
tara:strand:+ start:94 stop:399 length:306 start_codon:yes stop_codon:yes gene_type:complete